MSDAPKLDSPDKVRAWLLKEYPNCWETGCAHAQNRDWTRPEAWWRFREQVRNREQRRIIPGWWIDLCETWGDATWEDHYLYVSALDPKRIAYTPTLEYARADRQVVTTPGKYLMKHFPSMDPEKMRSYQEWHRLGHVAKDVLFFFDPAEIQNAYEIGPRSCMSYDTLGQYHEHPVRIYDGPDTVLAVLPKGGGGYSARALCRIDTSPMTYLRVYGDESVMRGRLESLGFVSSTSPSGARLRLAYAHPDADYPICPYVDWVSYGKKTDDGFLLLTSSNDGAEWAVQVTGGCACSSTPEESDEEENRRWCHSCDNDFHEEDDGGYDINEEWICQGCCERYYTYAVFTRNGDETFVYCDDVIEVNGSAYWNNQDLLEGIGFVYSEHDSEWIDPEDSYAIYLDYEEDWTTQKCVQDWQEKWILKSGACHVPDHPRLGACYFDRRFPPEGVVRHPDGIWTIAAKEPA